MTTAHPATIASQTPSEQAPSVSESVAQQPEPWDSRSCGDKVAPKMSSATGDTRCGVAGAVRIQYPLDVEWVLCAHHFRDQEGRIARGGGVVTAMDGTPYEKPF